MKIGMIELFFWIVAFFGMFGYVAPAAVSAADTSYVIGGLLLLLAFIMGFASRLVDLIKKRKVLK